MINTKNLTMDQEVAVMMPTGQVDLGHYMAESGDKYIVLVGEKSVECEAKHMYPAIGASVLIPGDYVKPLQHRDGRCGYFLKVDGPDIVLFNDLYESDMPEKARRYPADTRFALVGDSADREITHVNRSCMDDDIFGGSYNAT